MRLFEGGIHEAATQGVLLPVLDIDRPVTNNPIYDLRSSSRAREPIRRAA